jgi:hypothetical protein
MQAQLTTGREIAPDSRLPAVREDAILEGEKVSGLQAEITTQFVPQLNDGPVDVSVVIPCLNEANSIAFCVEKAIKAFRTAGLRGEVVVADNGSTDGSIEISEKLGARVIRVPQHGYGAALRAGITAAGGEFIVMGDADDSYDFYELPRFVEMWRKGFDVVMGNRFRGEIKPGAMPWHHKYIGNPGLTTMLNLFFHAGIGDSHCGMRGFTRAIYDRMDLRSTGMEFASSLKRRSLARASRKFPSRCGPTSADARRICAAFATAGGICASCCCTPPTGFFSCRARRWWLSGSSWFSGCSQGRGGSRRALDWTFTP